MKKITLLKESDIHQQPDKNSPTIKKIPEGQYIDWSRQKSINDQKWFEVILPGNEKGYVSADHAHKWTMHRVDGKFVDITVDEGDGKKKEIRFNKGEIVFMVRPMEKVKPESGQHMNHVRILSDKNLNIGTSINASISNFVSSPALFFFAFLCGIAGSIYIAFIVGASLLSSGIIVYGTLVLAILIFITWFITATILYLFSFIQQKIDSIRIRL